MPLNARQTRFVAEYLVDGNATQAAVRAGYSPHTAGAQAHKLLKIAEISAAVAMGQARVLGAVELSAERVLAEITRLGRLAESTGDLAVALKAQEHLGKHLKLFTDKLEVSGKLSLEQLLMAAAERRNKAKAP